MIGRIILLVTIISNTPMQAVMPSSCTIGISISMITAKPSALVSSATAPGTPPISRAQIVRLLSETGRCAMESQCTQAIGALRGTACVANTWA